MTMDWQALLKSKGSKAQWLMTKALYFGRKNKATNDPSAPVFATLNRRLLALTLDALLMLLVLTPISNFLYFCCGIYSVISRFMIEQSFGKHEEIGAFYNYLQKQGVFGYFMAIQVFTTAMVIVAVLFCWRKWGATPGAYITGCKLVDASDNSKLPTVKQLLIRMVMCPLSLLPLAIGMFMINFTKRSQALHDKVAGTVVIVNRQKRKGFLHFRSLV